jgi:threonine/homoserine/homoserine lactone efflux protein
MNALEMLIRGLLAGVAIAAPVGPVNVLCASRTISRGWRSGLFSGLGAAAADTLYGSIAGFSISLVIHFLVLERFWVRLLGGTLLLLIGVLYYFKRPPSLKENREVRGHSDFFSTFLLTLTNPTTVLSFLAVLAALGMDHHNVWWLTVFLVAGIFCGSMAWWIFVVSMVNRMRDRFNGAALRWMNRIAGLAIGAFGVLILMWGD